MISVRLQKFSYNKFSKQEVFCSMDFIRMDTYQSRLEEVIRKINLIN